MSELRVLWKYSRTEGFNPGFKPAQMLVHRMLPLCSEKNTNGYFKTKTGSQAAADDIDAADLIVIGTAAFLTGRWTDGSHKTMEFTLICSGVNGTARALIDKGTKEAHYHGAKYVVLSSLPRAYTYYPRLGFKYVDENRSGGFYNHKKKASSYDTWLSRNQVPRHWYHPDVAG